MQQKLTNLAMKAQRFMMGRYGGDQLNMALLILSIVISVVCVFLPYGWIGNIVCTLLIVLSVIMGLTRLAAARAEKSIGGDTV